MGLQVSNVDSSAADGKIETLQGHIKSNVNEYKCSCSYVG